MPDASCQFANLTLAEAAVMSQMIPTAVGEGLVYRMLEISKIWRENGALVWLGMCASFTHVIQPFYCMGVREMD